MGQCSSSTRQADAVIAQQAVQKRRQRQQKTPPPPVDAITTTQRRKVSKFRDLILHSHVFYFLHSSFILSYHQSSTKKRRSSNERTKRTNSTSSSTRRSARSHSQSVSTSNNTDFDRKIKRKSRTPASAHSASTTSKPPLSEIRRSRRTSQNSKRHSRSRTLSVQDFDAQETSRDATADFSRHSSSSVHSAAASTATEIEVPYTPEPVVMMREPDILSDQQSQRLQKLLAQQEKAAARQPGDTSSSDSDDDEKGHHSSQKSSSNNSWAALTFDGNSSVTSGSSCTNGYETHLRMSDWDEIKHFVDSMDEEDMLDVQDAVYAPRHRDSMEVVPGSPEEEYFLKLRGGETDHSHSGNTETTRSLSIGSSNHTASSSIGDQGLCEGVYFEEDDDELREMNAVLEAQYLLDQELQQAGPSPPRASTSKRLPPRSRPTKTVSLPAFRPSISVVDASMRLEDVFGEDDYDQVLCTGGNGSVEC